MWNVLSQLLAKMSKVIVDEYDKTDFSQPWTNF